MRAVRTVTRLCSLSWVTPACDVNVLDVPHAGLTADIDFAECPHECESGRDGFRGFHVPEMRDIELVVRVIAFRRHDVLDSRGTAPRIRPRWCRK